MPPRRFGFGITNPHLSSNEPGAYGLELLSEQGTVVHSEDVGIPGRQVFGAYD